MRFEIGKTYKFDKEKFMEINGVEQYKEYKKLLMMAMFAIQMNFGLILV